MKLAKDFECCPLGEIYPRILAAGEDCPPELEESARALGLLADEGGDGAQGGDGQQQGGQDPGANEDEGGQQAGESEGSGATRIVLPPRRPR